MYVFFVGQCTIPFIEVQQSAGKLASCRDLTKRCRLFQVINIELKVDEPKNFAFSFEIDVNERNPLRAAKIIELLGEGCSPGELPQASVVLSLYVVIVLVNG